MGPSGSGKSTLLNIIGGVICPQQGKVIINGREISSLRATERDRIRADSVGYIFQQFNLIPYLSAIENVLLSCRFSNHRKNKLLANTPSLKDAALVLLHSFFSSHVPDFNKPVSGLSVGQQQRIAAARALIGSPSLVIADEPTSALDYDAKNRFMQVLLSEVDKQGSTLLFVSHDPGMSNQFDSTITMQEINQTASQ